MPPKAQPSLNREDMTQAPEGVDPHDLITIRSSADAEAARLNLVQLIWGRRTLPDKLPAVESSSIGEHLIEELDPLVERVETLVVILDAGMVTRAFHFIPRSGNGNVVILHDGHDDSVLQRTHEIEELMRHGYAVIAFSMPLVPPNSQPDLTLPTGETIRLQHHDQLAFLTPDHENLVRYFLEPIIQVVNFIERETEYRHISMSGISGGGWTTVMAAAIDPRISASVPIAGSFPIYLRALNDRDWGDLEQTLPAIYSRIGYLDLYVLGSEGCGRRQVQIFYEHDPCCFAGRAGSSYEAAVQDAVESIGPGTFEVRIDSRFREHAISPYALEAALDAFAESNAARCP